MAELRKIDRVTEVTSKTISQPEKSKFKYYTRGSWEFVKKMWPAIFELSTTETYVNASAIAFNILLSFFSFFVLIGSFLINVLHWDKAYDTLYRMMRAMVPIDSSLIFQNLDNVKHGPGGKATIISFALLIFSSSGIFQPMEIALNRAWGFKQRSTIKQYSIYLGLTFLCGIIMFLPVAMGTAYDFVLESAFGDSLIRDIIFKIIGPIISLPFIAALFFLIYYVVPNGKVRVNQVFFTSVAMAALWAISTLIFRLSLPLYDFKGSYGQMSALMALVTWVFITSFILILGANLSVRDILTSKILVQKKQTVRKPAKNTKLTQQRQATEVISGDETQHAK